MSLSLRLRQDRHALVQEMRTVCNSKNPSDAARWKELDVKQEALRAQIQDAETNNLETEMSTIRNADRPNVDTRGAYPGADRPLSRTEQLISSTEYRTGFERFVRTGKSDLLDNIGGENRAATEGTGTQGGYLVPVNFQRILETKLKSYAGLRQACRIISTPQGGTLQWPTMDDTTNVAQWLPETNATTEADPVFGQVSFTSNLLSSQVVKVSVQLMQDSFENIESILSAAFAKRIGRTSEPAYLTGNGSGQPNGLLTALLAANVPFQLATGANANSGNSADTDLNSIGTTDIDELLQQLDPDYQQNASFMGHSATWARLRRTLDKYGRPIWQTSLASGAPDTLWGKKIYTNQQMAQIGAGNISLLVGDFSEYVIRDVLGMTMVRFNELYMPNYEIGYQMFIRTDGQLLQPAAFSYLQHPDS